MTFEFTIFTPENAFQYQFTAASEAMAEQAMKRLAVKWSLIAKNLKQVSPQSW